MSVRFFCPNERTPGPLRFALRQPMQGEQGKARGDPETVRRTGQGKRLFLLAVPIVTLEPPQTVELWAVKLSSQTLL